jgi:hypothetical protein
MSRPIASLLGHKTQSITFPPMPCYWQPADAVANAKRLLHSNRAPRSGGRLVGLTSGVRQYLLEVALERHARRRSLRQNAAPIQGVGLSTHQIELRETVQSARVMAGFATLSLAANPRTVCASSSKKHVKNTADWRAVRSGP